MYHHGIGRHWGHCQNVYHGVYNDEDDGKLVIYLETGSHLNKVEDGGKLYQEHYHDYRLDVPGQIRLNRRLSSWRQWCISFLTIKVLSVQMCHI